ncbi:hypothetical protein BVY00_01480 [bacterium G20]|nr:hypothetical protein BVY00_01480 [bacterium G20]
MSTALLMYGLVRWLFKRRAIAYFAGYAAAFVPFHQFKAQSHIVYMYGGVFVAIIWAYLWFIKRPSLARVSLLAATAALSFYFDGYYILFTSLLIGGLVFFGLLSQLLARSFSGWPRLATDWKDCLRTQTRYLAFFGLLLLTFLLPIIYTQVKHGNDIKQSLSFARGSIRTESLTYSSRPIEFFLPSFNNPLLPASYSVWRLQNQHSSNPSEDDMYIGYTVAALAILGIVFAFGRSSQEWLLQPNVSYRRLVSVLGATLIVCLLFSLPYRLNLAGHYLYLPSAAIIRLSSNWRVLSRLFLVIDPLVILLAAAGLYGLAKKWPRYLYLGFVGLCSVILFFEYLTSPLRPHGDLYKDTPKIYQALAADNSVKVIAEYPMIELATGPATFTFAQVHGKKLINANDPSVNRDSFHAAIAGLNDPQTLGVLKSRGVDVVTTLDDGPTPGLNYYLSMPGSTVRAYHIAASVDPRPVILATTSGFSDLSVDKVRISHRVLRTSGMMKILGTAADAHGQYVVGFEVEALQPGATHLSVSQNHQMLWEGSVTHTKVQFSANADAPIDLKTTQLLDITNMQALNCL